MNHTLKRKIKNKFRIGLELTTYKHNLSILQGTWGLYFNKTKNYA